LGDGNGISIRAAGAGNAIRCNYVHHLVAPMKMQSAIRTDGGQNDTLIKEDVIYKCVARGIILNNRCGNNIIADLIAPPRGYYLSLRGGPITGATIQRNIYFCASDLAAGRAMLKKQQRDGVDLHSLAVDPQCVDAASGDFPLKSDSVALKRRFVPIDFCKVGLIDKRIRKRNQ
jgi:hypothetical protein